jgi:hypothetical protein
MNQALFRAYRYGQERPVFCYRLIAEGSIEEKVYGRSVNKQGLALRVIDRKSINRSFSKKEVADLCEMLTWVQCEKCEKWRMLLGESDESLPDMWYCEMNDSDPRNNSCESPERDQNWYELHGNVSTPASPQKIGSRLPKPVPDSNDPILKHLLTVSERNKESSLVSRYYHHDAMLEATPDDEEVEKARKLLDLEEEKLKKRNLGDVQLRISCANGEVLNGSLSSGRQETVSNRNRSSHERPHGGKKPLFHEAGSSVVGIRGTSGTKQGCDSVDLEGARTKVEAEASRNRIDLSPQREDTKKRRNPFFQVKGARMSTPNSGRAFHSPRKSSIELQPPAPSSKVEQGLGRNVRGKKPLRHTSPSGAQPGLATNLGLGGPHIDTPDTDSSDDEAAVRRCRQLFTVKGDGARLDPISKEKGHPKVEAVVGLHSPSDVIDISHSDDE